eukprot:TRINITY_DN91938_c0_g1_i1.p1 TRINITY_DN91938_c0_g1~~TRINITY_DN91938_c0_g1_i1.p1  ORF type:complete len:236 (+),score=46.34 TRINITY_DN91938_c0_g1_i1:81-788(+)
MGGLFSVGRNVALSVDDQIKLLEAQHTSLLEMKKAERLMQKEDANEFHSWFPLLTDTIFGSLAPYLFGIVVLVLVVMYAQYSFKQYEKNQDQARQDETQQKQKQDRQQETKQKQDHDATMTELQHAQKKELKELDIQAQERIKEIEINDRQRDRESTERTETMKANVEITRMVLEAGVQGQYKMNELGEFGRMALMINNGCSPSGLDGGVRRRLLNEPSTSVASSEFEFAGPVDE